MGFRGPDSASFYQSAESESQSWVYGQTGLAAITAMSITINIQHNLYAKIGYQKTKSAKIGYQKTLLQVLARQ